MKKRRRMTVRPSRGMITASRIFGGVFAVVGVCFAALGVTALISASGLFGVIWVLISLVFVGYGVYGACNKNGIYAGYDFSVEEESEEEAPSLRAPNGEERLQKARELYDHQLITREEYEKKREEILKEL